MAFLELSGVQKQFSGGVLAVEDFNLAAERGEFVSFLGPSGCGKTTTLRMIAGFEQPTSGTIRIDGADMTYVAPNRRHVGMVFQSYALFPNMTVAGNIGFGLKLQRQAKDAIDKRVTELLELIHLEGRGDRYPYQLSGGQQQRVGIARAVAMGPKVLLLDEITSALDPELVGEVLTVVRELAEEGMTMIVVTHEMTFARDVGSRIVFMDGGRILVEGTPREVLAAPRNERLKSFLARIEMKHHG